MNSEDLKNRTKAFAMCGLHLADSLPNTSSGRTIANQLVRCGTSVGANYRSACRGKSKPGFIAKLGIVEEEVDESAFWLELIVESGIRPFEEIRPLQDEADELTRIMASSIKTSRASLQNSKSEIKNPKSEIRNPKFPAPCIR
jgi:four helix bundle protein